MTPSDQDGISLRSDSAAETEEWGARLAPGLDVGDVVTLHGPLGSGKTCFVTGLARGLEARGRVRSPSFGLIHELHGRVLLAHVDLYRLDERAAETLGLEELRERGVLVVEWGEKLPASLQVDALSIDFDAPAPTTRRLTARGHGARGHALLEFWRAMHGARGNA